MAQYGLPKVIGSVKLRNAIKRQDGAEGLIIDLHKVGVNGRAQGCSGFVTDEVSGRTVYVSTDVNHGTNTEALYRTTRDRKKFTGGRNRYAPMDADAIAASVIDLINYDEVSMRVEQILDALKHSVFHASQSTSTGTGSIVTHTGETFTVYPDGQGVCFETPSGAHRFDNISEARKWLRCYRDTMLLQQQQQ